MLMSVDEIISKYWNLCVQRIDCDVTAHFLHMRKNSHQYVRSHSRLLRTEYTCGVRSRHIFIFTYERIHLAKIIYLDQEQNNTC